MAVLFKGISVTTNADLASVGADLHTEMLFKGISTTTEAPAEVADFYTDIKFKGIAVTADTPTEAADFYTDIKFRGVSVTTDPCTPEDVINIANGRDGSDIYCDLASSCDAIVAFDTDTHVRYKDIVIQDDTTIPPPITPVSDPCDRDNAKLPATSQKYFIPVKENDCLTFQYAFNDLLNTMQLGGVSYGWNDGVVANYLMDGEIVDACNAANTIPVRDAFLNGVNHYVGIVEHEILGTTTKYYTPIQGVQLDVSLIPYDTFYIKWDVHQDLTGSNFITYLTDEYEKINGVCCDNDRDPSCSFESSNSGFDDAGYYWNDPAEIAPNSTLYDHKNDFRVRGSMELVGFSIEKEFLNDTTSETSSTKCKRFLFRSNQLSEAAAERLACVLHGQSLLINGENYKYEGGEIDKNNDQGKLWYVDLEFKQCNEVSNFGCS